ncbi:MAG: DUF3365 domain-containing protein [Candidatus Latescibacterota bacterium]
MNRIAWINHVTGRAHMLQRLMPLILIAFAGLSCNGNQREIGQADIERAQSALKPFKKQLMSALTTALADGPDQAIRVCSVEAPRIARDLSSPDVEMGRTSHRLRNPENTPRSWMEPLLAGYVSDPAVSDPKTVMLDDHRFGYVEPIYVQSMCLTCHGDDVALPIRETIAENYPGDEAMGFNAGDFRGMFWVVMPLSD